ncbi:MAG: hypothetical protein IJW31_04800 [Lentisphaeria bacterium]|nr:hypothetical protein [Lentisphaeria bacterium]MBR7128275.1 hypothetical protein [Lentisphaeria bacterium]
MRQLQNKISMSDTNKKFSGNTALIMIMAVFCLLVSVIIFSGGCSPQERSGVGRLPHNRPANWEYRSFAN